MSSGRHNLPAGPECLAFSVRCLFLGHRPSTDSALHFRNWEPTSQKSCCSESSRTTWTAEWVIFRGLLWEPKERTHNLETWGVRGDPEVGEVGHDSRLYRLAGVP